MFIFKGQVHDAVIDNMQRGMDNYDVDAKHAGVTDTWNVVQSDFKCCGVNNFTDWKVTNFSVSHDDSVPDSCCVHESKDCGKGFFDKINPTEKINEDGCFDKLEKFIIDNIELVGGIIIALLLIQVTYCYV